MGWVFGCNQTIVRPVMLAKQIEQSVVATGLKTSIDDDRDIVFVPRVVPTAQAISRANIFPQVQDQGSIGICTGETMTTIAEAIENTRRAYTVGQDELSRRYNYFYSRQYDGLVGDSGATPRSMCRSAKNYGLPPESAWPYSVDIDAPPTSIVVDQAKLKRLGQYEVMQFNQDDRKDFIYKMESAIAEGCLVALAFRCKRWMFHVSGALGSLGHQQPAMDPFDPMNEIVGGHIVPVVGYDRRLHPDSSGSIIIQNSWGTAWGDGGRWSINYMLLTSPAFAMEVRVFRGFAGITLAEPAHVPLTVAEIQADRQKLSSMGLCALDAANNFYVTPIPNVHHFGIYTALKKQGRTHAQMAESLGISAADIDSFASNNAAYLTAWA
jgi:Papain family cysteine protease